MGNDGETNAVYYRNREETERTLAHQAPTDAIREIHMQLAKRYAELADEFEVRTLQRAINGV
jgi:hypothetical protein